MDRRTFLASASAGAGVVTAGCLGGVLGSEDNVVLDEPESYDYDRLRDARDRGDLSRPIYGDKLPEATFPAPLHDREVTTTEFVGDSHVLLTFIFTRCVDVCPGLTANLVRIQSNAIEDGYEDDVAFLPTTFDPAYDTADRLEAFGREVGVDYDAGNWYFLKPESEQRVEEVLVDQFGVGIQELSPEEREERGMHEDMAYIHSPGSYILANADGYVERGYPVRSPNIAALLEDFNTLRERW